MNIRETLHTFYHPGYCEDQQSSCALQLLGWLLGKSRAFVLAHPDQLLTRQQQQMWEKVKQRSLSGEPIEYIVGHISYRSLQLKVNPHVLIPREDTNILIEKILQVLSMSSSQHILDVGTGSGVIALSLKQQRPQDQVDALDLSWEALEIAQENGQSHHLKVQWFHSNLLEQMPLDLEGDYDVIVANLPYIDQDSQTEDESEHKGGDLKKDNSFQKNNLRDQYNQISLKFEPKEALYCCEKGLKWIKLCIIQAKSFLKAQGLLFLEFSSIQLPFLKEFLVEQGYQIQWIGYDYVQLPRFIQAQYTQNPA